MLVENVATMFSSSNYELLDFGDGRKLERFGGLVLDRPSPSATRESKQNPRLWRQTDARFDPSVPENRRWQALESVTGSWFIEHGPVQFDLRLTGSGQVGVFPEQAENWDWIQNQVGRRPASLRILNLFAYTGGSTLAAAAAGANVVHVDASRGSVNWARANANHSRLADKPIRWIVDDAVKFVQRERRRHSQYDAIILDPPSYGHGPKGETWKIDRQLSRLLDCCAELLADPMSFVLLTCHTPEIGPEKARSVLEKSMHLNPSAHLQADYLTLRSRDGRQLPSGIAVRLSATQ